MTTINTIEDLIRLLDENPEWLEALRARLLTRELLELPEKFDQFVNATNKRFDAHDRRFDAHDRRFDAHDRRFDQVEASIQSLRNDLAPIKGAHARNAAVENSPIIAMELGFNHVNNLTRKDLIDMVNSSETSDLLANDLRSFRLADLVIEATDAAGETCYIAVEISFTANGRDTDRALRNAAFLTRFTGHRSYPAVVGMRKDHRIEARIESGEVLWHQLEAEDLEAE